MLRIGFVVSPGFQVMSFAAVSAFELANVTAGETLYDIHLLSETGGPVASSWPSGGHEAIQRFGL